MEEYLNQIIKKHYGMLSDDEIENYNKYRNDGCEPLPFVDLKSLQWTEQTASGIDLERYFYNEKRRLCVASLASWEMKGHGLLIYEYGNEQNMLFVPLNRRLQK